MAMDKKMATTTEKFQKIIAKTKKHLVLISQSIWSVGRDDPRRFIHALKVGLALTLVSLLYLMEPLFKGIGENTMWAVMTVVVVLEFTAGATLCKGLNRGLGTFLAGLLAFMVECIADRSTRLFHAIFIGAAVFVIGTASAYVRFIPYIKKHYDYGVLIFLLTFNLVTVSSYRVENVLMMAQERFYTIAIGCGVCLLMSLLVFPNWSGDELHNSIISKIEGLAGATEACVSEYFSDDQTEETREGLSKDYITKCYKAVLHSKSKEETLALHANWEPRYIRKWKFSWSQYEKIGSSLRHFGYSIVALHGCLQTEIQTPRTIRVLFKKPCIRLASEMSKALLLLAESVRSRRRFSQDALCDRLNKVLQDFNIALKSQPKLLLKPQTSFDQDGFGKNFGAGKKTSAQERKVLRPSVSKIATTSLEFSEALPFAAFASLLVEAVARLDLVIEEVEILGRIARFKECQMDEDVVNIDGAKIGNSPDLESSMPSGGAE